MEPDELIGFFSRVSEITPTPAILDAIKKNAENLKRVQFVLDITEELVKELVTALSNNTQISSLELWDNYYDCHLSDYTLAKLFAVLKRISSLKHLELHWCRKLSQNGVKQLIKLVSSHKNLESLWLVGCQLGHESIGKILEGIKKKRQVFEWNLSYNSLGVVGAHTVSTCLSTMDFVTKLDISNNRIDCDGLVAIAGVLGCLSSLEYLQLGWNNIQEHGTVALAQALKVNLSLKDLKMMGNMIGDKGAVAISEALMYNTTLKVVHLDKVSVREEGLNALNKSLDFNFALIELVVGDLEDEWEDSLQRNRDSTELLDAVKEKVVNKKTINRPTVVNHSPHFYDISQRGGNTVLHWVCGFEWTEQVQAALDSGADPNYRNQVETSVECADVLKGWLHSPAYRMQTRQQGHSTTSIRFQSRSKCPRHGKPMC